MKKIKKLKLGNPRTGVATLESMDIMRELYRLPKIDDPIKRINRAEYLLRKLEANLRTMTGLNIILEVD